MHTPIPPPSASDEPTPPAAATSAEAVEQPDSPASSAPADDQATALDTAADQPPEPKPEKPERSEKTSAQAPEPEKPQTDALGKPLKTKKKDKAEKDKLPDVSTVVQDACAHIERLFEEKLSRKMVFHDLEHTRQVTKAARRLAADQLFSPDDTEVLLLAAWFHDSGYTERYLGHEAVSADLAAKFLQKRKYPAERIELVRNLILATEVGARSNGRLADTLVDADRSGMARDTFAAHGELLRAEWEMHLPDRSFSNPDWLQYQLEYLTETDFRTEAAQLRFGPGRATNIEAQEKAIGKRRKKEKKKEKESRETLAQPKRGIETMFHNIYGTHTSLSQMADQKANMMIQLNTLLLSALITYLAARTTTTGIALLQNPIVAVPGALLLFTALGSVVTAILSAQPEITSFRFNNKVKPTANRRINLLFFGNFTKLPLEEFQEGMRDLMRQKDALYINMITDIYYLGDVLSKKYRLLKVSYTIFMVGIIMTVFSFLIAVLYKGHL